MLGLIDFYHAAKQLSDAVKLRRWSATQRTRWLNRTRGLLKRARVDEVITALRELCRGRTAGKIRTHLNYFLKNRHRFAYTTMVGLGLPRGSGAVESAIRRVINLRIKGASIYWLPESVDAILLLRSFYNGGHYILDDDGRDALLEECPASEPYVRPFVGSQEYLHGRSRWLLWLGEAPPELLRNAPALRERVAAVRELRRRSKRTSTRALADTPTLFQINLIPTAPFLVVPEVSSEHREYVPIGWLEPPAIPSNLVRIVEGATKPVFALLASAMHMAWLRHIGGRLKSDYRYSIGLVYNTFPLPPGFAGADTAALERLARAVLDARAAHPGATLADL